MPDTKISDLAELTSLAATDEFVVVDKSDTAMAASGTNKRVKKSTLDAEASLVALAPSTSARNVVQPTGAAIVPFTIKGAASQSANLQEWQNSAGTVLGFVDAGGRHLIRADPGAVPYATLALMNNTPDDPPAAKRPALNFVHKAADGTETADWQWGEDVASDPPDLALFHPASGMDFLYITNEDNPRMGVATGTWDAPPEGSLSVVSRVTNRPALTFVTNDEDHEGWMARWGWGTGVWRGGIDSQTGGIAVGWGSSAPLALLHLDEGTTAAKGVRFGSDAVPLVMFRSAANKLTLQGQQEIVRDTGAFANALVLRNADMTAAGHGVGIRFDLGRITATEEAGYIRMLAEQTYTADTATHDSAMTFATATDTVLTEKLRLTSSGKFGIANAAPTALLHVGGGQDSASTADVVAMFTAAGSTALAVRDSTNDAEAFLHASSASIQFGTRTVHDLIFKTSDVERMRLAAGGGLRVIDDVELEGALNHDGATVGFYAAAPVAQETGWGDPLATESALRTPLTTASTLDDTRRYVKTLAKAVRNLGLIGA